MTDPRFLDLEVDMAIRVGRVRRSLQSLSELGPAGIIELDTRVSDPVVLCVGTRDIAEGELVELDDGTGRLGLRITKLLDPEAS